MLRLVSSLLGAFVAGFVGHYIPFEKLLGSGWSSMATHATGVMFALPFICLVCKVLGMSNEDIAKVVVAYLAVYTVEGTGTFSGYWSETVIDSHISTL